LFTKVSIFYQIGRHICFHKKNLGLKGLKAILYEAP